MADKDVAFKVPKRYGFFIAAPTFLSGVLLVLLIQQRQMSKMPFDPYDLGPGAYVSEPAAVYEDVGCYDTCANDADCDAGLTCKLFTDYWTYANYLCSASYCGLGRGCASPCSVDSQCADGLTCTNGSCWSQSCGVYGIGCGVSCTVALDPNDWWVQYSGQTYGSDPTMCDPGFQCVGMLSSESETPFACWKDECIAVNWGGTCGDACSPEAPCGAELFCVPDDNGGDSTCWHPSCPDVPDSPQDSVPNPGNVQPQAVSTPVPTAPPLGGCGASCSDASQCQQGLQCSPDGVCWFAPTCDPNYQPPTGVPADPCAGISCGDGICQDTCGENVSNCSVDCHI